MNDRSQRTVVIIKGNPAYIENNSRADEFYTELSHFFEELGYTVTFNLGEPYTVPEKACVWVGHSRGADRLRFAPGGTRVIGIGVPQNKRNNFPTVNHPEDEFGVHSAHYLLTDEMKKELIDLLSEGE